MKGLVGKCPLYIDEINVNLMNVAEGGLFTMSFTMASFQRWN